MDSSLSYIFSDYYYFHLKPSFQNFNVGKCKFRKTKNEAYYKKQVAKRHKKNKNKKTHRKKY